MIVKIKDCAEKGGGKEQDDETEVYKDFFNFHRPSLLSETGFPGTQKADPTTLDKGQCLCREEPLPNQWRNVNHLSLSYFSV
jgi:hypothetical protein